MNMVKNSVAMLLSLLNNGNSTANEGNHYQLSVGGIMWGKGKIDCLVSRTLSVFVNSYTGGNIELWPSYKKLGVEMRSNLEALKNIWEEEHEVGGCATQKRGPSRASRKPAQFFHVDNHHLHLITLSIPFGVRIRFFKSSTPYSWLMYKSSLEKKLAYFIGIL